jgi:2-polyprenyl-6-methoxyphenol hydroxylase-like FAD-dependent oxidoreductase
MSPIVGQNMNTGFADVELLAQVLAGLLAQTGGHGLEAGATMLARWEAIRARAARRAANRAWAMMRLGTARGGLISAVRSTLVGLALAGPLASSLAGIFTMSSIPSANASRLPRRAALSLASLASSARGNLV